MSIEIQQNISLAEYTSFKIGGKAKYFCVAENFDEVQEALNCTREKQLAVFVLGEGSNVLISDNGFEGLAIRIKNQELKIKNQEIFVEGGFSLSKLVSESVKNNLAGLEWAAGIPGTVGGAVCNNAGAHGKSMEDIVKGVEAVEIVPPVRLSLRAGSDMGGQGVKKLTTQKCQFSYRNSIFKTEKKYIITKAILKLERGNETESRKIIKEYLESRKEKQPLEYPSAGSIFKNPKTEDVVLDKIFIEYPELKEIVKDNIIPVGWFIEMLGLKERKIGEAMISQKHGNFIVNMGNAKAEDVVILISLIKQKVRDRFGVQLHEEIEYVGF